MRTVSLGACLFAVLCMTACGAPVNKTGSVNQTARAEQKMNCHYESVTGSHIQYKVCRTAKQSQESHEAAERMLRTAPLPSTRPPIE